MLPPNTHNLPREGSVLAEVQALIATLEDAERTLQYDQDAPGRITARLLVAVYKTHRNLTRAANRGQWR